MVEFDSEKLIKDLCKEKRYEEIGVIVESNFRINDILNKYNNLTEYELILTILSYYIYRQNNPLEKINWDFNKEKIDLRDEMFRIAELDDGIAYLFDKKNEFFMDNIRNFIDVDFLKNCTPKSILYLYNNGYKDLIINNILNYKLSAVYLIKELLLIPEVRELIITKDFLLHGFNNRYEDYFLNLPNDRRELLGCYGAHVFGNDNYSIETCERFKKNLKVLFKNNFIEFDDNLSNRLIELYGNVSYYVICFTINNVILDNNYLNKMQDIADKYFNKRIGIVLTFCYKYQKLSEKIFKLDDLNVNFIKKINNLVVIDVLDGVDNLSVENFLYSDIDDFSYSFNVVDEMNKYNTNVSPLNFKKDVFLYSYYKEIAVIDNKGNWDEYLVKRLHDETLKEIYLSDKEGMDILYNANINGDIVFVTENAGLIVWLPSILNSIQKDVLLNKLSNLKNIKGVDIFLGIANPNIEGNYIYLNDGMPLSLEMAITNIKRIKIYEPLSRCKVLSNNM